MYVCYVYLIKINQSINQTDTGRQQRPRLRIASRGKKPETSVTTNTLYQTNYAEKEVNA